MFIKVKLESQNDDGLQVFFFPLIVLPDLGGSVLAGWESVQICPPCLCPLCIFVQETKVWSRAV